MSASSKKMTGILVGLLVIAATGAWFVGIPMWEKKQAEEIKALIASLPGSMTPEKVEVGLLKKSVTVTGLKGSGKNLDGSDLSFEIAKISASGVNMSADSTPGVTKLADSVTALGVTVKSTGPKFKQTVTMAEVSSKDLVADLHGILEQVNAKASKGKIAEKALTIRMGSLSTVNYVTSVDLGSGPLVMSMASSETKDMGLLSSGPSAWNDIKVNAFGQEMLTIEKMSLKRSSIFDVVTPAVVFFENKDEKAFRESLLAGARAGEISLSGFELENLKIKPMTPEAITLKKATFDLQAKQTKVTLKNSVEELIVPQSVYAAISSEGAMLAENLGKPLSISAALDFEIDQKDGKGDIVLKTLRVTEQNLGEVELASNLLFESQKGSFEGLFTSDAAPELLVKKLFFSLDDRGLIAQIFNIQFKQLTSMGFASEQMKTVDDLRKLSVSSLLAEAQKASPERAKLLNGAAKMVQESGKLTVTIAPEKPMTPDALTELDAPGSAPGITVEHTPPAK